MKYYFLFALAFVSLSAMGQDIQSDLLLIRKAINLAPAQTPSSDKAQPSKNIIVNQFANNCKYEFDCGQFRKKAYSHYGVLKGTFLTLDRINRCDRITHATASPYRLNKKGKMIDHWQEYTFK